MRAVAPELFVEKDIIDGGNDTEGPTVIVARLTSELVLLRQGYRISLGSTEFPDD